MTTLTTTLTTLSTTGHNTRNSRNARTNPGIAFGTHIPRCTAPKNSKSKSSKTPSEEPHGSLNSIPRDDEFSDGGPGDGDPNNPDDPDNEGSDDSNKNTDHSDHGDKNPNNSETGIRNNLAHAIATLARTIQNQGDGSRSKV
jgi:hypothetical protein